MKANENLEQLFRNSLENYESDVRPEVWEKVQKSISQSSAPTPAPGLFSSLSSKIVIGVISTAAVITAVVMINKNNTTNNNVTPENKKEVVLVQPKTDNPVVINNNDKIIKSSNENKVIPEPKNSNVNTPVNHPEPQPNVLNAPPPPPVDNNIVNNNGNNGQKPQPEDKKITNPVNPPVDPINPEPQPTDPTVKPTAIMVVTPVSSGSAPLVVTLLNKGNTDNITWDFGDNTSPSNESNPTHTYEKPGEYAVTLTAKDENGNVVAVDTKTIKVQGQDLFIENSFTPDGDGNNDVFSIKDKEHIESFTIVIQDKNGKVVTEWSNFEGSWDGRNLKGELCPPGIYIYVLNYIDKHTGQKLQKISTVSIVKNR